MGDTSVLTGIKDRIGTVILNRPERRNALSPDMLLQLHLTLKTWSESGDIRAVVITGAGETAFSAGYDLSAIASDIKAETAELLKTENPLELAFRSVREFPFPVIAMLRGYVLGAGCHLSMCCDIRIAADDIQMGMPPARLGIVYHPDGLQQFIEVIGMARTREIFFTAGTYAASQVLEMGMVNQVVPASELSEVTYAMADGIARNAPLSLTGIKRILNMLGSDPGLSEPGRKEAEALVKAAFDSRDLREGQAALIEKRPPVFSGQ